MPTPDCTDRVFCQWAGGCEICKPDTWRSLDPRTRPSGSYQGASFEFARKHVKDLAEHYRQLATDLEQAHADGWRLYDMADNGLIHLAKGRAKR
jgi:hypothetical protein